MKELATLDTKQTAAASTTRCQISVTGIVQGVGFRPFVFGLAADADLAGHVGNNTKGVFIEVEGRQVDIDRFVERLQTDAPPAAKVRSVAVSEIGATGSDGFRIVSSVAAAPGTALVSPDLSTCGDCLRELADPDDRRFGYPFVNCTNCGPRFTITRRTPYDRPDTTMAGFEMCPACRTEYEDPDDRRFHAQPNACPACGPRVWLDHPDGPVDADPIVATRKMIARGHIVAIKGIGGFHLACDARSDAAVLALRERKQRPDKPFALMVADVATAERIVVLGAAERELIRSPERPIVVATCRPDGPVAAAVAPETGTLGVMLPYSPLHQLLLAPGDVWVMTSGNRGGEPIITDNDEALMHLRPFADAFLLHDRDINAPCDDSVVQISGGAELPIRRSRSYAPYPVALPVDVPPMLATGGELKATFCLAEGRDAFMSQHVGDMENIATLEAFSTAVTAYERLFRIEPEVVATDLHPGYLSTRWARETRSGLRIVGVQHHHAHIASVMAENRLTGPVIGFSFDGTGFGTDGTAWGGEVLVADYQAFRRIAHLAPVPLPGGDAAVVRPYRTALAHLAAAGVPWEPDLPPVAACDATEQRVVRAQIEQGINSVPTSSMGRLFDTIASIAGVRQTVTYEAQAAIALEALVDESAVGRYRFDLTDTGDTVRIDAGTVVSEAVKDLRSGVSAGVIAARFHRAVAALIRDIANLVRDQCGISSVGLSGGVFQNATLAVAAERALREAGFSVATHRLVPPNDGGLALGQAVIASQQLSR